MLKPSHLPALLAALLTLSLIGPAQAQWKWRDTAGKIQYSDRPPPPGVQDKDILQRPPGQALQVITVLPPGTAPSAPAPAPVASGPSKAEQDQAARQKQQDQEQLAKQKDAERKNAQVKRENCARAQENMKMLQDGGRINRLNENGERAYLDDAQRAQEVRRTQDTINSECR